jgi:autotransporter-associated beta strand protein
MGNPASNIIVRAGATISFYDTTTPWDKKFRLFGNGSTPNIWNYNGTHTIVGTMELNGNCLFGGAPVGRGIPVSITLSGPVSGTGSLIKSDPQNTLVLAATNDYAGSTTVSNGTLQVDGVSGTNFLLVAGGTLTGVGWIRGAVTVQAAGTLSPGDSPSLVGTLTISNSLVLAGTNVMDVSRSGGVTTSDLITNVTSLVYGGVLQLNLTGEPLAASDIIKLYSFNSASSAFSAIVPESPGPGLKWDATHLTSDGTLRVASLNTTPPAMTASISGNHLTLTWPADHTGWILQGQTNSINGGLGSTWFEVPGSISVNSVTITIDPLNGAAFYRLALP